MIEQLNRNSAVRILLTLTTVVVLLGVRWMLDQTKPLANMSAAPNLNVEIPDFLLIDGTTRQYDDQGKLSSSMQADRVSYFIHKDQTLIENPELNILTKQDQWKITAAKGNLDNSTEHLKLTGGVHFLQKNADLFKLETENLEVDSLNKTVSTNANIEMRNDFGRSKAKGLLFNLESRKLKLLGPVSAAFKPTN